MTSFIFYSFLGWLAQSIYLSFKSRSPVNAGFLLLPFCPMYGFCMLFLVTFAYPHNLPLPLLFLACFVTAAAIEYYTSLLFEQAFDLLLWDYSIYDLSLNGRTVVPWSAFWGAVAALALTYVHPEVESFQLPHWIPTLIAVILITMIADFAFGVDTLRNLKHRLAEMTGLREKFGDYLRQSNACETPREMLELNIYANSYINAVHRKGIFTESYSDIPAEHLAATLALIKTRHENLSRPIFAERRLLGAFPLLKVYEQSVSLHELQPHKKKIQLDADPIDN